MDRCKVALASVVAVGFAASGALGDIAQFTTSQTALEAQALSMGKVMKGIEDFEYANVPQQAKLPFPNTLQNGVPAPGLPAGINSPNLIIQSNITPNACPANVNPSNSPTALWINGAGFLGSNSIKVGTDEFLSGMFSSLDLIFTSGDKTAVGLDVSTYVGFAQGHQGFIVCAYDTANNPIGSYLMPGPAPSEPTKSFIGIWSPVPIGRVNVWGIFDVPQPFAVDNIEMWSVPAPGSVALLGVGALAVGRRRR